MRILLESSLCSFNSSAKSVQWPHKLSISTSLKISIISIYLECEIDYLPEFYTVWALLLAPTCRSFLACSNNACKSSAKRALYSEKLTNLLNILSYVFPGRTEFAIASVISSSNFYILNSRSIKTSYELHYQLHHQHLQIHS